MELCFCVVAVVVHQPMRLRVPPTRSEYGWRCFDMENIIMLFTVSLFYALLLGILKHYLYVKFGLNPSHTHGDSPLHGHVIDLGHHGGVALQVPVVVPTDHD